MDLLEERLEILNILKKYVEEHKDEAEVMIYGSESIAKLYDTEKQKPFYAFLAAFLSPRTKDSCTYSAVVALKKGIKNLSPKVLAVTPVPTIQACISQVGFAPTKARRLQECCKVMVDEYGGQVPDTMDELVKLPGVGAKIAAIVISSGFDRYDAIAVDTHVLVIANRLGWASSASPDKTREQLEKWLPKEDWPLFNLTMVAFGQCCCSRRNPKCQQCPIRSRGCCSYVKDEAQKKEGKKK